jgi:hypothetical protein
MNKKINVAQIRRELLKNLGDARWQTRGRLPVNYSTHPVWQTIGSLKIKVLSTAEAKFLKPKSRSPHRIFVWDEVCSKWQYAGKYEQHQRMIHKEVK